MITRRRQIIFILGSEAFRAHEEWDELGLN
jgi:hypothetical protein